jgi:CheY-like chemotaxis protein
VSDGVEALEAATRLVPEALVIDRILPRMRAEDVAERLREIPATAGIPIIVLATAADLGPPSPLFRAQVEKPLARLTLTTALEAALGALDRGRLS